MMKRQKNYYTYKQRHLNIKNNKEYYYLLLDSLAYNNKQNFGKGSDVWTTMK